MVTEEKRIGGKMIHDQIIITSKDETLTGRLLAARRLHQKITADIQRACKAAADTHANYLKYCAKGPAKISSDSSK